MSESIPELVHAVATRLTARGEFLVCAESCTGGLVAASCTALAGSSAWFDRGFVTYSNEAKHEMLGVEPALIGRVGAVSEEVAAAMAQGALKHAARATWALAITGIAGPTGGSADKPVGTVWLAWVGSHAAMQTRRELFVGDRGAVREQACRSALRGLLKNLAELSKSFVPR